MAGDQHIDEPDFEDNNDDEDDDDLGPIDESEREALHQDLLDVKTLKSVIGSRGIKGVVVFCPDCEDDHFLGWDLLAGNLEQILESGKTPVHEPAWQPDPDEYVSWDYARGFLDGYETYPEGRTKGDRCGYCGTPLPERDEASSFCSACGKDLAPLNLIHQLRRLGWEKQAIDDLLEKSGFEPPLFSTDPHDLPFRESVEEEE